MAPAPSELNILSSVLQQVTLMLQGNQDMMAIKTRSSLKTAEEVIFWHSQINWDDSKQEVRHHKLSES